MPNWQQKLAKRLYYDFSHSFRKPQTDTHALTPTHSRKHTHTHSHQVQLPALLERDARYETRGGRVEQEEDAHAAKQFEIVKYSIYCMHFQRSSLTVSYWTLVE